MSTKALALVWEDPTITNKSELLVLLAIADFANDKLEAWPSIDTIAAKSRHSDRGVQKVIYDLKKKGKLTIRKSAGRVTNVYRIIPHQPIMVQGMLSPNAEDRAVHPNGERHDPRRSPLTPNANVSNPERHDPRRSPDPSGTSTDPSLEPSGSSTAPRGAGDAPPPPAKNDFNPVKESQRKYFSDMWVKDYPAYHDAPYLFQGAKDGSAITRLLATGLPVEDLIETAIEAWKRPRMFNCKQASTIAGFAARFNDIRAELQVSRPGGGKLGPIIATKEVKL